MATKPGTLSHAKGFVINKLYEQKRFGGSHVPVAFLSQGYPPKWRHLVVANSFSRANDLFFFDEQDLFHPPGGDHRSSLQTQRKTQTTTPTKGVSRANMASRWQCGASGGV